MKYLLVTLFLLPGFAVFGQKISGMVIDKTTREPIVGALVNAEKTAVRADELGEFEINLPHPADSLKITALGYKTFVVAPGKPDEFLTIALEPNITNLNEVTIYGDRSFKKDSLANRADFQKQFNYKGLRVIDAFANGGNSVPGQLISINVLLLVQALTKKSTPEYKFNKVLIRDEHEQYVDEHFNRGIVSRVITLQGDTLSAFLVQCRPTYEFVLKATDYDMEIYITQSFAKFKKNGFPISDPFVMKN